MAKNKLTHDSPTLFVDQWGGHVVASSRKELLEKTGGKTVQKQYCDIGPGRPGVWTGYVVHQRGCCARWFTAFKRVEIPREEQ